LTFKQSEGPFLEERAFFGEAPENKLSPRKGNEEKKATRRWGTFQGTKVGTCISRLLGEWRKGYETFEVEVVLPKGSCF